MGGTYLPEGNICTLEEHLVIWEKTDRCTEVESLTATDVGI